MIADELDDEVNTVDGSGLTYIQISPGEADAALDCSTAPGSFNGSPHYNQLSPIEAF